MSGLGRLFKFIELTHAFQQIRRSVLVKGEDRKENDMEHSYQLAMAAWYIIDSEKLDIDSTLALKYALVHDLVEVFAGDVHTYTPDRGKKINEEKAASRLAEEYPEFREIHELIARYELRKDPESKFVYALDKILPAINIFLDGGRSWKEDEVTLEMLIENKAHKISVSPEISQYFDDFLKVLQDKKPLFYQG